MKQIPAVFNYWLNVSNRNKLNSLRLADIMYQTLGLDHIQISYPP